MVIFFKENLNMKIILNGKETKIGKEFNITKLLKEN